MIDFTSLKYYEPAWVPRRDKVFKAAALGDDEACARYIANPKGEDVPRAVATRVLYGAAYGGHVRTCLLVFRSGGYAAQFDIMLWHAVEGGQMTTMLLALNWLKTATSSMLDDEYACSPDDKHYELRQEHRASFKTALSKALEYAVQPGQDILKEILEGELRCEQWL